MPEFAPRQKRTQDSQPAGRAAPERGMSRPVQAESLLLALQQVLGNRAVQHLLRSGVIQAKLKIGQPGGEYEQPPVQTRAEDTPAPRQTGVGNAIIRAEAEPLDEDLVRDAISFNNDRLQREHSVLTIRRLVGAAERPARFDRETVERIVAFQRARELAEQEGRIGEITLEEMVGLLEQGQQQNAAIRLVMDYYKMKDYGGLRDIRYNKELGSDAIIDPVGDVPTDSKVQIGPTAFKDFSYLVHTVAHELEHVRQNKTGEGSEGPVSEFLGEAREILSKRELSKGLPWEESADLPWQRFPDFMDDARRCFYEGWAQMSPEEKKKYGEIFKRIRQVVLERYKREYKYHQDSINAEIYVQVKEKYESAEAG